MKTIRLLAAALILFTACKPEEKKATSELSPEMLAKAKAIHQRVMTLDTHNDINVRNFTEEVNYTQELDNQVNLPKMKKGGLDVSWFIVYTGQGDLTPEGYDKAYKNAMDKFNAIHRLTEEIAPNDIELALSSADAKRIYASGKKVAMIGIENGYPVGTDINRVKEFYDLGARYMSLSHNGHSQLCDSNTGEADDTWLHNGVSDLGKEVLKEMNKWGIMIDVSHPSKQAMKDMIELSKAPIIASHSSARALCDHSRNLDDEQLEWLKKNGGVVQTVAFNSYVNTEKNNAYNKVVQEFMADFAKEQGFTIMSRAEARKLPQEEQQSYYEKYMKIRTQAQAKMAENPDKFDPVNVADFVDHIDYMVKKIGIDHVGISSDFDGGGGVEGWNDASETLNVTIELVKRGYTEAEIEKLWSGNLLRVLDEVEAIAKKIQNGEAV
ncbi:peptidase M19 [Polaribacter pacificus]|uniref:Peptidase M19 n=1 Tax=Polaribacter pacificus TaxID=1775173 RepID=A0A917HSQ0_9FLAO|nr:dipeptidase [Polaribacter pacificus]GGG88141.1 peptidase M19 [Polaribacter pacificus]